MEAERNERSPREFLPVWLRLLLIPGSVVIGYVYIFITGWFLPIYLPDIFVSIEFYSIILVALILFNLKYRKGRWLSTTSSILFVWMIVLWFSMPMIAKPIIITNAQNIIPAYPDLELVEVKYDGPRGDRETVVTFVYRSDNPEDDFSAIKEFYENTLDETKWPPSKREVRESNSAEPYGAIVFWPTLDVAGNHFHTGLFEGKGFELAPRVNVSYKSQDEGTIQVTAVY